MLKISFFIPFFVKNILNYFYFTLSKKKKKNKNKTNNNSI